MVFLSAMRLLIVGLSPVVCKALFFCFFFLQIFGYCKYSRYGTSVKCLQFSYRRGQNVQDFSFPLKKYCLLPMKEVDRPYIRCSILTDRNFKQLQLLDESALRAIKHVCDLKAHE